MDRETATQEIKARLDLAEVVGRYVSLERAGQNYKGLCPFHQEKTPSFTVNPGKQFYYCFGCHATGDVFSFVMHMEGWDFNQALDNLAKEVGITLAGKREENPNNNLLAVMEAVCQYYQSNLKGSPAEKYLQKRGVTLESIKRFRLGYAPPGWENLQAAGIKATEKELLECGLIQKRRKDEGFYDRFRNRVIFPIFNTQGKVVAFGARALGEDKPKYLNSPEGALFQKKEVLYGWHLSKDAIRNLKTIVLVEGYLDLISCYEAGVENAVASMGTALTEEQIRIFARQVDRVVLAYDADAAGKMANRRSVAMLLKNDLQVMEAEFPQGFDPDDLYRKFGADALKNAISSAKDYLAKVLDAGAKSDLSQVGAKTKFLGEISPFITAIPSRALQEEYLQKVAQITGLSQAAVEAEILGEAGQKYERSRPRYTNTVAKTKSYDLAEEAYNEAELDFVAMIFGDPSYIAEADKYDFALDWLDNRNLRTILGGIISPQKEPEGSVDSSQIETIRQLAERLEKIDEPRFFDCLRKLAKRHIYRQIEELARQMANFKEPDFYFDAIKEYRSLLIKAKKLQ
ncbi:MAG TPA: DNA primase [Bacillota bacterium]|nr:DNA primase [Bacillota bacterium]